LKPTKRNVGRWEIYRVVRVRLRVVERLSFRLRIGDPLATEEFGVRFAGAGWHWHWFAMNIRTINPWSCVPAKMGNPEKVVVDCPARRDDSTNFNIR